MRRIIRKKDNINDNQNGNVISERNIFQVGIILFLSNMAFTSLNSKLSQRSSWCSEFEGLALYPTGQDGGLL